MRTPKHKHGVNWKRLAAPLFLSLAVASCIGLHTATAAAKYYCGKGDTRVETSIDFGCKGQATGLIDLMFAIIRFLSAGVGIIIIISTAVAGVQYIMSKGDPGATAKAIDRIRNNLIALGLFIFAYAILNYLIPAGFFV